MHPTQPNEGSIGSEDYLTTSDQNCTSTRFSYDTTETGVNVPPSEARHIWYRVQTPLSTSSTSQMDLTITINAAMGE